jgi:hypothetical protein
VGSEKVIAVDIFRERVFLRNEDHGSRIIPLTQLRLEVEQLGDVLPAADERSRQTAPTAEPGSGDTSKPGSSPTQRNSRSRGRRGNSPESPT